MAAWSGELAYDPAMFDYGKSGLHPSQLPKEMGFAGFRVNFHADWKSDIVASGATTRATSWDDTPCRKSRASVPEISRRSTR